MNRLTIAGLLILLGSSLFSLAQAEEADCPALLDHSFRQLTGASPERLCEAHRGKLVLVVNTASQCGYTYQYEGLEHLYQRFGDQGLVVLGFPSNDFGDQEPGDETDIKQFCRDVYSIRFPMYEKVHAAQPRAHPFFHGLAREAGSYPRWNFHKYLIDRHGDLVGSWRSHTEPEADEVVRMIKLYL